jgi:hypothetical protein
VVGTIGATNIAASVNKLGAASPYYSLVHINNFNGPLIPTSGAGSGPFNNGTFAIGNEQFTVPVGGGAPVFTNGVGIENVFIFDTNINLGVVRVTGWDFSIGYTLDLKTYGALQLGANAVLYVNNDERLTPQSPYQSVKGFANTEGLGTTPQYRVNALAEYRYQHWTLGFNYNYFPQTLNALFYVPGAANNPVVGAFQTIDSHLSYAFIAPAAVPAPKSVVDPKGGPVRTTVNPAVRWYDGVTLTVGCNNMFNQQPPFAFGFNSNTDLAAFDGFGRMVYFQVSKKF